MILLDSIREILHEGQWMLKVAYYTKMQKYLRKMAEYSGIGCMGGIPYGHKRFLFAAVIQNELRVIERTPP